MEVRRANRYTNRQSIIIVILIIIIIMIIIIIIIIKIIIIIILVHLCGASGSMRACPAAGPGSIPGRDRFPG